MKDFSHLDKYLNNIEEAEMYVVVADVRGGKKNDTITKPRSKKQMEDFVKFLHSSMKKKDPAFTNIKIVKASERV